MSDKGAQSRHSVESLLNRNRVLDVDELQTAGSSTTTTTKPNSEPAPRTKTFAFVNISDPTQAGDADNRKFVRQYVRPVKKVKQPRDASYIAPAAAAAAAIGLESGSLPFIVMSHPDQGSTAGTRKFVKQNAQRRFRKGKPRKPAGEGQDQPEETLATGTPHRDETSKSRPLEEREPRIPFKTKVTIDRRLDRRLPRPAELPPEARNAANRQTSAVKLNFWSHVDSSGAIFPVEMDPDAYRLVEYLHASSKTTKVPPAFMPLWFGLILHDQSAFNGLMSLALAQQSKCHKIHTEQKFIQFHSKALHSVQKRLSEPSAPTDSGLMTSIILFLIHDVLVDDRERYAINHAGLRSIINMRGGIETLESAVDQQIRLFILVAEVCGAISFNFTPEYYLPPLFLQMPPRVSAIPMTGRLRLLVSTWLEKFPERVEVVGIFSDVQALNAEVVLDCPNLWNRPAALTPEAYFLITRFVHLVNHIPPDQKGAQVETSLCMASLLYINILRAALGDYFTRLHHGLIERLMKAVLLDSNDWLGLEPIRMWCLVQGGIVSSGKERKQLSQKTREVMKTLYCRDWDAANRILADLIYVELLFEKSYEEFGKEVMAG